MRDTYYHKGNGRSLVKNIINPNIKDVNAKANMCWKILDKLPCIANIIIPCPLSWYSDEKEK